MRHGKFHERTDPSSSRHRANDTVIAADHDTTAFTRSDGIDMNRM
jgi:hypothetical protein